MHTSIYLLITIGVLAGFCMRPLNMFVFSKAVSLMKYINSKPIMILLMFTSMATAIATTFSTIYLSLKLSGFIPLADHVPFFAASFIVGATLYIIYARRFNRGCPIDLDLE